MVPTTATEIKEQSLVNVGLCSTTAKPNLVLDTKIKVEIVILDKYHDFLDYITCIAFLHVTGKPNSVLLALH